MLEVFPPCLSCVHCQPGLNTGRRLADPLSHSQLCPSLAQHSRAQGLSKELLSAAAVPQAQERLSLELPGYEEEE